MRRYPRALFAPVLLSLCALACSTLSEAERSKEYYTAGHFERAQDQCRRGLNIDPEDLSLRQVLGYSLLRQTEPRDSYDRRLQEAAWNFEQAIEREEEFDYRNRTGLGEVLARLVAHRAAWIEAAENSATPLDAEGQDRLTKLEETHARYALRAAQVLEEVLAEPKSRENDLALSTLARLKSQTREYERADELLSRLSAVLTRSIHLRGKQLEIENWPAEVRIAVHTDIDRLKQTRIDALKLRTNVLTKLGRDDDVVSTYGEIEAENAMQPADYFNRATSNARRGAVDLAIADYDKFITLAAGSGSGLTDTVREAMERKAELVILKRAVAPEPAQP
jgi:tetratricopeptide (TPR) repeat protein